MFFCSCDIDQITLIYELHSEDVTAYKNELSRSKLSNRTHNVGQTFYWTCDLDLDPITSYTNLA